MSMRDKISGWEPSPRGFVLAILGAVTLGVAVLSVAVSFTILEPKFGSWAVPTVFALDALWVVSQASEVLAGNNRRRALRVRWAGIFLTAVNAAIPTAELLLREDAQVDLAVVLTPLAIVATKLAWWVALPALGRKASSQTRKRISAKRQEVADRLEEMEAEAAHRIELLEVAKELEQRVAEAEADFREAVLKTRQSMTKQLYKQAQATETTVMDMELPTLVTGIALPVLGEWSPERPALLGAVARDGSVTPTVTDGAARPIGDTAWTNPVTTGDTQVSGIPGIIPAQSSGSGTGGSGDAVTGSGAPSGAPAVTAGGGVTAGAVTDSDIGTGETVTGPVPSQAAVTLAQIAAVAGVTVPEPGTHLNDGQLAVVLRHMRYRDDPPLSYRQAVAAFRAAGYVGGEERVRRTWGELMSHEENDSAKGDETAEAAESEAISTAAKADEEDEEEAGPKA
ncbi:hypothetical protein ACFQ7J_27275 [Streptomyces sp. NPDC056501]|uniref:hypothetical protein n=1 Tax=Streptomyces sp. NPDC056501 TaxID=3345841 RepID=UPI0036C30596